jgi:hypothetical protein
VIGNNQSECADIDNALAEFFSVTPSDPLMPGSMNNTDPAPNQFFYFYSPSYSCNGQTNPTLHVMNTETNIAVYNFNPCANQPSGPAGSPEQADYLQIIFTS